MSRDVGDSTARAGQGEGIDSDQDDAKTKENEEWQAFLDLYDTHLQYYRELFNENVALVAPIVRLVEESLRPDDLLNEMMHIHSRARLDDQLALALGLFERLRTANEHVLAVRPDLPRLDPLWQAYSFGTSLANSAMNKAREKWRAWYGFSILTPEAFDLMVKSIGHRHAIDPLAGNGWLAANLAARGATIAASDRLPWRTRTIPKEYKFAEDMVRVWFPVVQEEALSAIRASPDSVPILYWPPDDDHDHLATTIAYTTKATTLIFIGEDVGGYTANSEFYAFMNATTEPTFTRGHGRQPSSWRLNTRLPVPSWPNMNQNYVWIFQR